jgi:hypothetical protein
MSLTGARVFVMLSSSRVAVVAHASPEDVPRRAVLGGVLAAVLAVSAPSAQAGPVDIIDGTKLRQQGYDIIYEARDLDLPQARTAPPSVHFIRHTPNTHVSC